MKYDVIQVYITDYHRLLHTFPDNERTTRNSVRTTRRKKWSLSKQVKATTEIFSVSLTYAPNIYTNIVQFFYHC